MKSKLFQSTKSPVIILVDDVKEVVEAMETAIRFRFKHEFVVELCERGAEGLEVLNACKAAGQNVALIISDLSMPGMKGDEFLARAHLLSPPTPLVLMSGCPQVDGFIGVLTHAPLYRFLPKPWEHDKLMQIIRDATNLHYLLERYFSKVHKN